MVHFNKVTALVRNIVSGDGFDSPCRSVSADSRG